MDKKFGIHLYINIDNLNRVLKRDEIKNDDLKRTFHQVDTFIAALEKFVENFSDNCVVEKFTTSRLHFYYYIEYDRNGDPITISKNNAIVRAFQTACFALCLVNKFKDIGKYKNLPDFRIGVGVDVGDFVEFEFVDNDITELTTIGSPANRAAKLQSAIADDIKHDILISKAFFDLINGDIVRLKSQFFGRGDLSKNIASKPNYADLTVYGGNIKSLLTLISSYKSWEDRKTRGLEFAIDRANRTNISDIDFSKSRVAVNFDNLSLRAPKFVSGVMFYSDIRGFTNKVDMSKLSEAESFTKTVLKMMWDCVKKENGIHIQFQGDRESAVFFDYNKMEKDYLLSAILAGTRMLDRIDKINANREINKIDIGIGLAGGDIFLSRLGLKNGKFNIAMGQTVREADKAEDEKAGTLPQNPKSEIAITRDLYKYLCELSESNDIAQKLKRHFKSFSLANEYYVTNVRYSTLFPNQLSNVTQKTGTSALLPNIRHRKQLPWTLPHSCVLGIKCRYSTDNGITYHEYQSNGFALPKNASLEFTPTFLPKGWENGSIKWQVTNTGAEAEAINQLRGDIESSNIIPKNGKNTGRVETTSYTGTHYVQCFFVRNGTDCFAMSKFFEVKIV